jgi:hypothetical protein
VTAVAYRIRVRGHLDTAWSARFDGLAITHDADGNTTLAGPLVDQAALYGVIGRARDLGLALISVQRTSSVARDDGTPRGCSGGAVDGGPHR